MSGPPPLAEKRKLPDLPGPLRDKMLPMIQEANASWRSGDKAKYKELSKAILSEYRAAKPLGVGVNYTRRYINPMQGGKTRRNETSGGDIVTHLLTIRNQVKLYHWQTGSFARHTATDNLTAALDTNIDAFVESYMGRYGRPMVRGSIKLHNFSEAAAKSFVAKETKYLQTELPRKIRSTDTDLLNLRDTILGDLTKVLYLFTLA